MCIKPTSGCRGQGAANAQDAAGHGFHEYAVSLHPLKGKLALALCTHTADCIHGHVVTGSLPVIHFLATARLIMCVCAQRFWAHICLPAHAPCRLTQHVDINDNRALAEMDSQP